MFQLSGVYCSGVLSVGSIWLFIETMGPFVGES